MTSGTLTIDCECQQKLIERYSIRGRRYRSRNQGWSQIEVLASTMLVGVLMVGALESYRFQTGSQAQINKAQAAQRQCEILLGRILALRFEESPTTTNLGRDDGESSTDRTTWDDVDDYNNLTESIPAWSSAGDSADRWILTVRVRYVAELNGTQVSSTRTNLKEIQVTATEKGQELAKLVVYVGSRMESELANAFRHRLNNDDDSSRRPTAVANVDPRSGGSTLTVALDASESHDAENETLSYRWTIDGVVVASTAKASITLNNSLTEYKVTRIDLEVTDSKGNVGRDIARVVLSPSGGNSNTGGNSNRAPASGSSTGSGVNLSVGGDSGLNLRLGN